MQNTVVANISAMVKGTSFVTIDSETTPKMLKRGNPFVDKNVTKKSTMNGCIGFDYEKAVNRIASKEGKESREAKPRAWGVLTEDRIFVEHKGKFYLRMKVEGVKNVSYFVDGVETPKQELEAWLPKSSKSSTQSDLDGEVIERDISLENIRSMRIKGMVIS